MTAAIQTLRRHGVSLAVLLGMALAWQALSMIYRAEALPGEPMVPGWQIVFTRTLVSLSDYWRGGLGVKAVADGAKPSAIGGVLSILDASLDTIVRLYTGLAIGALFGGLCGLAVSWSNWSRRLVALPLHLIRTLPLLAMVPLFQLWFGTYFVGKVIFIAYGVGVISSSALQMPWAMCRRSTSTTPWHWERRDCGFIARSSCRQFFRNCARQSCSASGPVGRQRWGQNTFGAQSGLGYIIVYSEQFAYLDRMFLIALVIVVYACVSYAIFNHIVLKWLALWMPGTARILSSAEAVSMRLTRRSWLRLLGSAPRRPTYTEPEEAGMVRGRLYGNTNIPGCWKNLKNGPQTAATTFCWTCTRSCFAWPASNPRRRCHQDHQPG